MSLKLNWLLATVDRTCWDVVDVAWNISGYWIVFLILFNFFLCLFLVFYTYVCTTFFSKKHLTKSLSKVCFNYLWLFCPKLIFLWKIINWNWRRNQSTACPRFAYSKENKITLRSGCFKSFNLKSKQNKVLNKELIYCCCFFGFGYLLLTREI